MRTFSHFIVSEAVGNFLYIVRGLPGSGKSKQSFTL